jgi:hypothetical protein
MKLVDFDRVEIGSLFFIGGVMTGEQFFEVWKNRELRNYLIDVCKSFSKNMTIQEDLLQEAWLRISQCSHDKTTRYYMNQGFKAIDNAYHIEWRGWRLTRWGKKHKDLDNRVKYTERKYIDKNSEKTAETRQ